MPGVLTYYFSRVIGNTVYSSSKQSMGKLKDLIVELDNVRPKVAAALIKVGQESRLVDFSTFVIEKNKGQYVLVCEKLEPYYPESKNILFLKKYVLDKQLVDMNGRKLVRVNDLRFANLASGAFLVAVDVGFEGLLRRLGIAKPLKQLLKFVGVSIPSHLILWDDVETVDFGHAGIKLAKSNSNLSTLHPSDLADIIEDMDRNTQMAVFASLDDEKAADVLEEMEPDAQVSVIESLSVEKAADLLEIMPADEAADILDELNHDKAEELLGEMEEDVSDAIRELLEYPEHSVGSIMATDYICFSEKATIDDMLKELRQQQPEADMIYHLYVVNHDEKLVAEVSLRDIVVSQPSTLLEQIMNRDVPFVYDTDDIESLNEPISKYDLLAVPVVNAEKQLVGMVVINDVIDNLLKSIRKR